MKCKICGNTKEVTMIYHDVIGNGAGVASHVGDKYTKNPVKVFLCDSCDTIWNDYDGREEDYYQSEAYRKSVEGSSDLGHFYAMHDFQNLSKFQYTKTEIYRDKIVCDIGCGGGGFLDSVDGMAKKVVAVEPSMTFQKSLREKGFDTFSYGTEALVAYENGVDVVVSFDCIEHVEEPQKFLEEAFRLLKVGGTGIIGTPTDAKVMRALLGKTFDQFLFTTQHPFILSEKTFVHMAKECGITSYSFQYHQRYTLDNCLYWLQHQKGCGYDKQFDFVTDTMNAVWKSELEQKKLSDYIVFQFHK